MKQTKYILLISYLFLSLPYSNAQWLWNIDQMTTIKNQIRSLAYHNAYQRLIKQAERTLTTPDYSVTYKQYLPPSGDKHDYVSLSRYWWADTTKVDGIPYIYRDGESNPELDKYDRNRLGEMCDAVNTLSLAYFYSHNEQYAQKAVQLIRTWFINKATRMNPNLNYSQFIPGVNHSKGQAIGLIDTYSFVTLLNSIQLLNTSKNYTRKDKKELQKWFTEFINWFVASESGQKERAAKNNHGTCFDIQLLTYYLFVEKKTEAYQLIDTFAEKRIYRQIKPDGTQPHELWRTLAYHYSNYNLEFITDFLITAKSVGKDYYAESPEIKARYLKAFDFLIQYLGKDREAWKPYLQISNWETAQYNLCDNIYRLCRLIDPSQTGFSDVYYQYANRSLDHRNRLLYGTNDPIEEIFQFAGQQFDYALLCTAETAHMLNTSNKVNPRSVEKDGSLKLVTPRDWCSGFFPGSLWYMYEYTKNPKWREQAEKYSSNIESEKFDRSSHDVGFKMNCSYGNAYRLTANPTYKDVLIQSAETLSKRYNQYTGQIRSWDWNRNIWKFPVIIDNMMNLELLFEATLLSNDSTYYRMAESHATRTLQEHFRDDFSSFHVVDYDPESGSVLKKQTFQGYADDSAWARGQAWGLYGFTMSYRYTGNPEFLRQAIGIANYIFSHPNLPYDYIPYWDFNDPKIPDAPRDASAACIIASALYELARYTAANRQDYITRADRILSSLIHQYRTQTHTAQGFLLLHSTGNLPGNDEIDVPLCYADYYFLEALIRRKNISLF